MDFAGIEGYGYDLNGNTTSKTYDPYGTTLYSYDYENRMTHIAYPGGTSADFVYNGDGLRVRKVDIGVERKYLFDGARVYGEYDSNWNEVARFVTTGPSYGDALVAITRGRRG